MITSEGALHIKRYMAGFVPAISASVAFGIGNRSESFGETRLQFETGRADIKLTSFDFTTNRLIYKAELPEDFGGSIHEAAIFSSIADDVAGEFGSKLIASFDSESEDWNDATTGADATYMTGNSRLGADSIRHTPVASATKTDVMSNLALDLSGYSGSDIFLFAYHVANANTANIVFRFMTDASNYYSISLGAQTAGYKITEMNKSTASATGSPNWAQITELRVLTTSKASGTSSVDYDGIRIEDADTINPNYVMVAREVLGTPFVKEEGKVQEIEFALEVNI